MRRIAIVSRTLTLILVFMCCSRDFAQQFMKQADITDAQFDAWVTDHSLVRCRAIAQAAYPDGPKDIMKMGAKPSGACYWDIDRAAAVAPPALVVHAGTRVLVRIRNPRQNEVIQPALVYAKLVPPSPGNDVLKNAVNPLQAITLSGVAVRAVAGPANASACEPKSPQFDPIDCQLQLTNAVNSVQASINHANAALACLESYQIAQSSSAREEVFPRPKIDAYRCSPATPINPTQNDPKKSDSFAFQKDLISTTIRAALALTPPLTTFSTFDAFISQLPAKYPDQIALDAVIKGAISNIQSAQATMQQAYVMLMSFSDNSSTQFYYFDVPHLTTVTATITGTEIVSKTASSIATWTTSSTSYNFVFSAGLGFSNLVYRTYANTPQVQNGSPVLNPSGNGVSIVTETDVRLSVLAPEVIGSYVVPGLRRLDARCSFGCSLLVSGGIGANLTTKSADFDTGISLRLVDVLLTPSVHFGRESRLIDGIAVGSQLGANAPSTLPTENKWVRKFGFVLTYVIPLS
jgi:hypothetical protein